MSLPQHPSKLFLSKVPIFSCHPCNSIFHPHVVRFCAPMVLINGINVVGAKCNFVSKSRALLNDNRNRLVDWHNLTKQRAADALTAINTWIDDTTKAHDSTTTNLNEADIWVSETGVQKLVDINNVLDLHVTQLAPHSNELYADFQDRLKSHTTIFAQIVQRHKQEADDMVRLLVHVPSPHDFTHQIGAHAKMKLEMAASSALAAADAADLQTQLFIANASPSQSLKDLMQRQTLQLQESAKVLLNEASELTHNLNKDYQRVSGSIAATRTKALDLSAEAEAFGSEKIRQHLASQDRIQNVYMPAIQSHADTIVADFKSQSESVRMYAESMLDASLASRLRADLAAASEKRKYWADSIESAKNAYTKRYNLVQDRLDRLANLTVDDGVVQSIQEFINEVNSVDKKHIKWVSHLKRLCVMLHASMDMYTNQSHALSIAQQQN